MTKKIKFEIAKDIEPVSINIPSCELVDHHHYLSLRMCSPRTLSMFPKVESIGWVQHVCRSSPVVTPHILINYCS